MSSLMGRSAFVTGSTQGVGLAIASALFRAGARVLLHGLRDDAAAQAATASLTPPGHLTDPGRLTDEDAAVL